ncbi:MEIOTIC F-BOX protein MOF-like [Panicum virgatum]|uniref:MEIOTIC F-BOX protein MOF-like n=1 Tax=Panicum virgatum TaxID=38727 RepID=UPI0019D5CAEF|nr:MEIOTIC F-BOX protein MOF-like [Panicum virgatum]
MAPKRSGEMLASKPATRSPGRCPAIAEDRLSSLQDRHLHRIMSFLTARQPVRTCVLSRRWRNLWRSMPCLDIDQREFDAAAPGAARGDRVAWECGRFVEFVDCLLMLHGASSLDRFRCHVTHGYEFKVVDRWIRHGINCNPAVMEISWSSSTAFFSGLPHSGSTGCRLKRLHLAGIALDTGFARQLRSGCPVLEDLQLERCLLDSPEITSHTLKSLIVTDCTSYFDTVLTITSPALASFHLAITTTGSNWRGIIVNEMPSLVKASIRSESPVASCKLLCSLVHVGTLELSGSKTLNIPSMFEDEPDGDVQNAGGGVVDEPEGFEVEGVDSVAPG